MAAAVFRTVFAQPDATTVAATWEEVRDQLAGRFPNHFSPSTSSSWLCGSPDRSRVSAAAFRVAGP
jgi:hypothetical protein